MPVSCGSGIRVHIKGRSAGSCSSRAAVTRKQPKGAGGRLVSALLKRSLSISLRLERRRSPRTSSRATSRVKVNAVAYFRVEDPTLRFASAELSVCNLAVGAGPSSQRRWPVRTRRILAQRDTVNGKLRSFLIRKQPWGNYSRSAKRSEAGDIPEQMQRAIAKQAEAERERAQIHTPKAVRSLAKNLPTRQCWRRTLRHPAARLQTWTEIRVEKKEHHDCVSLPIDIINTWMKSAGG